MQYHKPHPIRSSKRDSMRCERSRAVGPLGEPSRPCASRALMPAILLLVCLMPGPLFAEELQFHPVMILATKVQGAPTSRPGYVEPWLLTDGNARVFVYDYCRALVLQKKRPLSDRQLGAHVNWLRHYCVDKPVKLAGNKMFGMDNWGTDIAVGDIFLKGASYGGTTEVRLPETAIGARGPDTLGLTFSNPVRFYVVAPNQALLRAIVPVSPQDSVALRRQAEWAIGGIGRYLGIYWDDCSKFVQQRDTERCIDGWMPPQVQVAVEWFKDRVPKPTNAFPADLDGDGNTDLVVGFHAESTGSGAAKWEGWRATAVVFNDPAIWVRGSADQPAVSDNETYSEYGSTAFLPKAVLRFGECMYLAVALGSQSGDGLGTINLVTAPRASKRCPNTSAAKLWDMNEFGDRSSWVGKKAQRENASE